MRAVQRPTSATGGQGGTSHLLLVAIAIGLALGAALLVARERADQRIDGPEILADGIGCPATAADRLDPEAAGTLVLRWHAMRNGHPGPLRVALVPVDGARDPQVGTGLTSVLRDGARTAHLRAEGDDEDIAFVVGGVNGLSGERAAMESDLLVLVAQEGTPLAEAQAAAAGMAGLGRMLIWGADGAAPMAAQPGAPEHTLIGEDARDAHRRLLNVAAVGRVRRERATEIHLTRRAAQQLVMRRNDALSTKRIDAALHRGRTDGRAFDETFDHAPH